jgi:uncharacterized damage-inducible protein DinB
MTESQRIADQLRRAHRGKAWHGPALEEVLAGVSGSLAARRSIPGTHTIWEIVLHVTQWENIVRRRLAGERLVNVPPEVDWPEPDGTSPAAWQKTLLELRRSGTALSKAVARFPARRLDDTVPGKRHSYYNMLHGVIQHGLYHSGQIALLKKAR